MDVIIIGLSDSILSIFLQKNEGRKKKGMKRKVWFYNEILREVSNIVSIEMLLFLLFR